VEEVDTAEGFRVFAATELRGNSPVHEALSLAIADCPPLIANLDGLPERQRQPNLLLAAAQFLGGPGSDPDACPGWILAHWDEVAKVLAERRTQTNEAGRCAVLLPALARIGGPLALLEVGASAGLCLYPDRYRYDYGVRGTAGPPSEVLLTCDIDGPAPEKVPEVVWRAGIDLNPLEVRNEADLAWLDALIWPGQDERRARLRAAARIAAADPPRLIRGDLLDDLPGLAGQAPSDATLVIFHSAVLYQVDADIRTAFVRLVGDLNCRWIAVESPHVLAYAGLPPIPAGHNVLALDGQPIAYTSGHGQSLRYL
jgi:hypothetical protein